MLFFNDYGLVCLEVNVAVGLCTDVVNLVSWYVCNHLPTIKQEPVSPGQLYMVAMQFVLTKWDVVSDRPSALVRVAHGTVGNIQNDGVKLLHGISFSPGVHRAVVVCCFRSVPTCRVFPVVWAVLGLAVVPQCRVLCLVPVVTAELLAFPQFHRVLAVHRELKPCAGDAVHRCVPFSAERVDGLCRITAAVGGNQKVEGDAVSVADVRQVAHPDGCILGELPQQGSVCNVAVHHVLERGADYQNLVPLKLGVEGGCTSQISTANAEVVTAGAGDGEQLGLFSGARAVRAHCDFHKNFSFCCGRISLRPVVCWCSVRY